MRSRNLSDGERLNRLSDEQIVFLIAEGGEKARLSSSMPAFKMAYSPKQMASILHFVRSLARPGKGGARVP